MSDQKVRFIREHQKRVVSSEKSMTELCEEQGISRKTGYKLVRRHQEFGWAGLGADSRAPKSGKHWAEPDIIASVIETRLEFPEWGAKKIIAYLREIESTRDWPVPSVAHDWIRRAGLIYHSSRSRRFPHPGKPPQIDLVTPNQQWSVDFKGHFRTRDRRYCYPLTVVDSYSRFVLACHGMVEPSLDPVWTAFERLFREYGLPDAILSDNGTPFSSNSVKRLSKLAVRWIRLSILPRLTEPGKPQQNGRHERMHRELKKIACADPAQDCKMQQPRFDAFLHRYNDLRPHEAHGQQPPARHYTPSTRAYPKKLPEMEYGAGVEVRRVRSTGEIKWRGQWLFLSESLIREPVAFEPATVDTWILRYGSIELGYYSEREKKLYLDRTRPDGKVEN